MNDMRDKFDKIGKYKTNASFYDNNDHLCDICKQKKENELNYIPKKDGNILIICDECIFKNNKKD